MLIQIRPVRDHNLWREKRNQMKSKEMGREKRSAEN